MEIFVEELSDKTVVGSDGAVVGDLHNVSINFATGELENLIVTPNSSPTEQQTHRAKYNSTDQGRYLIPTESVSSVKDHIVVE